MKLIFTKMHGLGNDYVFVDCRDQVVRDPAALARAMSDRHTGIGADGLILIKASHVAEVAMEVYNADGSRAQMCGNGIRCVAKYAVERGLSCGPHLRIETDAGVRTARYTCQEDGTSSVRVDMGRPLLEAAALPTTLALERVVDHPLEVGGQVLRITCVSLGNPHAVCFVDDLSAVALEEVGPRIERAAVFPERINFHIAQVEAVDRIVMKPWERGSGLTRACGTGACAVCVAGVLTSRSARAITAMLPGGELQVEWAEDEQVYLTGPAVEAFSGTWPE